MWKRDWRKLVLSFSRLFFTKLFEIFCIKCMYFIHIYRNASNWDHIIKWCNRIFQIEDNKKKGHRFRSLISWCHTTQSLIPLWHIWNSLCNIYNTDIVLHLNRSIIQMTKLTVFNALNVDKSGYFWRIQLNVINKHPLLRTYSTTCTYRRKNRLVDTCNEFFSVPLIC